MKTIAKIPSPVIYLMAAIWTLQVCCFAFGNFDFYNTSFSSVAHTSILSSLFWTSAFVLLPAWRAKNLWKFLASVTLWFSSLGLLFIFLGEQDESHLYFSLLKSQPLAQAGYTAKLEKQFDTVCNDCRTKVVLSYERNYWNVLKETKEVFSLSPSGRGSFEISPDGKFITVTATTEDANHQKSVETFSTDWNLVKPKLQY